MSMKNKIKELAKTVLFDEGSCYVYSKDATNMKKSGKIPLAIIFPESIEEVQNIVRFCYQNNIAIIPRGAGTNLVGACTMSADASLDFVVICFSKMNKIIGINQENLTAQVQAGVVIGELQSEAEALGLFYPPDPSNLRVSTVSGGIALSSGGPRTFKYGGVKDYLLDLKVVLADGTLINTGSNTVKNATGYNLTQLFVGSEGTLGIVVEATLKLIPKPQGARVILAYFNEVSQATTAVNEIIKNKLTPSTLDFMDKNTLETIEKFYPNGLLTQHACALVIEVDGYALDFQQEKVVELCEKFGAAQVQFSTSKEEYDRIWTARRSGFGACAKLKPNVVTEDVVVPRENIAPLVKGINEICANYGLIVCVMGHIGDGNIHPNIALDLRVDYDNYQKAKLEIYKLAIDLGGTLSGEHGIGCEKSKYMELALDEAVLGCMKKIKKVFDEKNLLNPYKIFER